MDSAASTPIHRPLQGKNDIRVLSIHPAEDFEAPIHCTLKVTSLDDPCAYEAVSYSWTEREDGVIEFNRTVVCDGHPMPVTDSAFGAIRRFRLKDEARVLWIDAICIDQSKIPERTHQVSVMAKVYSTATALLVWLGEDSSLRDGCIAMRCFEGLGHVNMLIYRDGGFEPHPVDFNHGSHLFVRESGEYLRHLFMPGNETNVAKLERFYADELQALKIPLLAVQIIDEGARAFQRAEPHWDFALMRRAYGDFECSDDKDRVFALLNLTKGAIMAPDYSLTTADVYYSFA
ncbi:hypothetical protein LTR08_001740 [Meristemomyces frigidus]|nr:hypothetical protein LTR08_001740 [Meristemomyces frigidus]